MAERQLPRFLLVEEFYDRSISCSSWRCESFHLLSLKLWHLDPSGVVLRRGEALSQLADFRSRQSEACLCACPGMPEGRVRSELQSQPPAQLQKSDSFHEAPKGNALRALLPRWLCLP